MSCAAHGRKSDAKQADSADILTVDQATDDKIAAERHATGLFSFDPGQVKTVEVSGGDGPAQGFTRTGPTSWKYNLEPELPIEETKVKSFLVQINDPKAARYVAYAAHSLTTYGLDQPPQQVTVTPTALTNSAMLMERRVRRAAFTDLSRNSGPPKSSWGWASHVTGDSKSLAIPARRDAPYGRRAEVRECMFSQPVLVDD